MRARPLLVEVRVDRDGCRRWLESLEGWLGARVPVAVRFRVAEPLVPLPGALATLLALEGLVHGEVRRGVDRVPPPAAAPAFLDDSAPEIVLNLSGSAAVAAREPGAGRVLQPRYDGALGDAAIAGALLNRACSPLIEIEDVGAGRIVARGRASLEAAGTLGAGMEAVFSRAVTLVEQVLAGAADPRAAVAAASLAAVSAVRPARAAGSLVRALASRAARAAYRLACWAPHWRVGWRFTDKGVWDRRDLGGARWNVLPDPGHRFFADPFPVRWGGRDFIFFEDLDHRVGKGIISCVEIRADGTSGPAVPVLEEPWHLSYPFLIEHGGSIWMIPESSANNDVSIYRASAFPFRWERHAQLLTGVEAADATVVRHDGRYWMFAATRPGAGGYSDTLSLFHAGDLFGDWRPHSRNPVLVDPALARPAGGFVRRGGVLMRPVQDCRRGYGTALALARITRLDEEGFAQEIDTILTPDECWPGRKLHTLNRAGRLEAIDGSVLRPRLGALRNWVDSRYRPGGSPDGVLASETPRI